MITNLRSIRVESKPVVARLRPALLLAWLLAAACPAAPGEVRDNIDWPAFMSRHDLVWDSLPKAWHESAFLGNGLLGAAIYSEGTNALQWDVGRSDVTDRGNRLAIGRFALAPAGASPAGTMRLDLWNAEARGVLRTDKAEVEWRSFTHTEKLVTVIEVADGKGSPPAKIAFQPLPATPAREEYKGEAIPLAKQNPAPAFGESAGVSWCRQAFKAGGGYTVAWAERELSPGRRWLAFTVDYTASGEPVSTKAVADVQSALQTGLDELARTHREWWHTFWPRSFLSIPDTRMESFYWIQIYKFASGTRADRPALDLMGPWFRRTPWPKIWWNLNIQLTYWPVYAANRLDLGESLTRMIDAGVPNLISNVPPDWRHDSAAVGRTSSYDCRGGVGGKDGEERGDLTWTLHNYWLQYRYSGDETMLRERLYPILKRAIGYYLHLLKPGPDGKLHLPLSLSPEFPKTAPDTNYDLALLRWGLMTLLACHDRLALHDPMAATWRDTLAKLTPFPVDPATGYMIGAGVPLDQSHRHFSHLLMVYPLHLVDAEAAADRPVIEQSLNHWIGFEGALQGYSFTGASAMSSWLGRKDASVKLLNEFLDRFVKANTVYLEAGPVIETPLAGAAAMHEILLQSWSMDPLGTHIRVFPGLATSPSPRADSPSADAAAPGAWPDATIHKMRAEGAFEVSAVRRAGRTRFVQIKSLAGAPCRVRSGLEDPLVAAGPRAFAVRTEPDRNGQPLTTIDLRQGETILLTSAKFPVAPADLVIEPVAAQPNRANFYGSRKVPAVKADAKGSFDLGVRQAKLNGSSLLLQKSAGRDNVGRWIKADEFLSWKLELREPGTFRVFATYATTGGGGRFAVEATRAAGRQVQKLAALEAPRQGTGGWDKFQEFELGTLELSSPGPVDLAIRSADGKPPMMNLRSLRLVKK